MSNLDQGLDAIIASGGGFSNGASAQSGKSRRNNRAKKTVGSSSTQSLGKAVSAAKASRKSKAKRGTSANANVAAAAFAAATSASDPLSNAKRVVVSGLPLDVDENAVKEYFSSSIGRIRNIKGAYNAKGGSTGSFTITFEKLGAAQRVLEKFNNQPIDGGKSRLSVQILIDASAATPVKSLAERIGTPAEKSVPQKKRGSQKKTPKKADAPIKAVSQKQGGAKKEAAKNQKQKKKPAPKTAADLDAEMSDYFASANKNEITV